MKYIGVLVVLSFLSLFYANAQDHKYFKVEKASYGTVLRPLSNEDLYRDVNQSPVYLGNNFNEYIIQVMNVMTTVITEDVWNKFSKEDKESVCIYISFDKTGKVFKMEIDLSDLVWDNTNEDQWNEICNKIKSINVIPYLLQDDYSKENFVHGKIFVRPFRAIKYMWKKR